MPIVSHKRQPCRLVCAVGVQDDLEKKSEIGRSCQSTRRAESVRPVPSCEVGEINNHAEIHAGFEIPFKCFCDLTLFSPAPAAATAMVPHVSLLYTRHQ